MAGASRWKVRLLAVAAFYVAAAGLDAYLWRVGVGVINGALGSGFVAADASVKCDGPVAVRADLKARKVRFRCHLALGGIWPFFREFESLQLESNFLAPFDRIAPRTGAS